MRWHGPVLFLLLPLPFVAPAAAQNVTPPPAATLVPLTPPPPPPPQQKDTDEAAEVPPATPQRRPPRWRDALADLIDWYRDHRINWEDPIDDPTLTGLGNSDFVEPPCAICSLPVRETGLATNPRPAGKARRGATSGG